MVYNKCIMQKREIHGRPTYKFASYADAKKYAENHSYFIVDNQHIHTNDHWYVLEEDGFLSPVRIYLEKAEEEIARFEKYIKDIKDSIKDFYVYM